MTPASDIDRMNFFLSSQLPTSSKINRTSTPSFALPDQQFAKVIPNPVVFDNVIFKVHMMSGIFYGLENFRKSLLPVPQNLYFVVVG